MYQQMTSNIATEGQCRSYGEPEIPDVILEEVSALVGRIEDWLSDCSYDRLAQQIVRRDGFVGSPSEGRDTINIIPGNQKVACTRITLALSSGITPAGSLSFPNVMRSVREYLIDCERMAKALVLITDTWSPRHIDEHIRDIRAHARQGRFVVPHLVTGSRLLRVDWPQP
jgi:hypothetical protein